MSEKKHRLQKRFSGALKLLGDGFAKSDDLMSYMGENRQLFMENLKTVLEKRKSRLSEGLEIENANYGIEEKIFKSSGNLWKDLDERFRNEKRLLVKWLQVGAMGSDFYQMIPSALEVGTRKRWGLPTSGFGAVGLLKGGSQGGSYEVVR